MNGVKLLLYVASSPPPLYVRIYTCLQESASQQDRGASAEGLERNDQVTCIVSRIESFHLFWEMMSLAQPPFLKGYIFQSEQDEKIWLFFN